MIINGVLYKKPLCQRCHPDIFDGKEAPEDIVILKRDCYWVLVCTVCKQELANLYTQMGNTDIFYMDYELSTEINQPNVRRIKSC